MSKNITLNGKTYSGVSTIKIGTANFIEESECGIFKQTFTIDQEYSESGTHGIKWLMETFLDVDAENPGDGVYIAKTLNNTGFADSNKEKYALEYMVFIKHGNAANLKIWRTNGETYNWPAINNISTATYIARGATLKTVRILEEAI